MITHTIESYWIPSEKKTKWKLQIWRICENFKLLNFEINVTCNTPLKMFDKMCQYEMHPTNIVEDTERTWFCPQTDRWMDGRMDRRTRWNQYTPFHLRWSRRYNNYIPSTLPGLYLLQVMQIFQEFNDRWNRWRSPGSGPVLCLLLRVSSGFARPITGQVTSVTWPVIGWV